MRLAITSDTHGAKPAIPFADVFVHCGDWSEYGTRDESLRAADWIAAQPHAHKLVVPGNHDKAMLDSGIVAEFEARGIDVLIDSGLMIGGYRFWGHPWTIRIGPWAFDAFEGFLARKAEAIPECDILISHGPRLNRLDDIHGRRVGGEALGLAIDRLRPILSLCGHIHEGYGHSFDYDTNVAYINAVHMDGGYSPRNRPYLVEVNGRNVEILKGGRE